MSLICVLAIIPSSKGDPPVSCSCGLSRNSTVEKVIDQISLQTNTKLSLNVHDIVINGNMFSGEPKTTELSAVCDGPTVVMLVEEKRSRSLPEPASVGDAVKLQEHVFSPEVLARFEPTQLEQHQKMMLIHQQRMGSLEAAAPVLARRASGSAQTGQPPPPLRDSAQPMSQLARSVIGGSQHVAESLVNEDNIMSLAQLGISRQDAVRALSSATSVDAAAGIAMSSILGEESATPLPVRSASAPASLSSHSLVRTSVTPSPLSLGSTQLANQTAVWDRTLRCIAVAAQGNKFAQDVLMCFRAPMMLMNNLSIASALPAIFQGERRLGNIANWERSSAANDAMLQAIEYCKVLDANPSAVPVPPTGCDPEVWEDSILLGRPIDSNFDKFFADSKQQISQVSSCFLVPFFVVHCTNESSSSGLLCVSALLQFDALCDRPPSSRM
jgi:hypothetical protein